MASAVKNRTKTSLCSMQQLVGPSTDEHLPLVLSADCLFHHEIVRDIERITRNGLVGLKFLQLPGILHDS